MVIDWSQRSVDVNRVIGFLIVALLLFVWVSVEQDGAIASQAREIERRRWAMGETIVKSAVVIEREARRRCIRFRFDDPFPLGDMAFFCDSALWERSRKGDRIKVGVRRLRVEWVER